MNPALFGRYACLALASAPLFAQNGDDPDASLLSPIDVFDLEYASDPRISPDGTRVVYVRNFMDIMKDRRRSNLWTIDIESGDHRPLTTGNQSDGSPRWSPDGDQLAYASTSDGSVQIWVRWMDTGQLAKVTNLTESPGGLSWSPDGKWFAFSMRVPKEPETLAEMPPAPEGAEWAPAAKVITDMIYRGDGQGYLKPGYSQVFVVPTDGGSPRQLTKGSWNHGGALSWLPDSSAIVISANRRPDVDFAPNDSEIYRVSVADGAVQALTDRRGPDSAPAVSPDGTKIAFLGFDDRFQGYQITRLYVMDADGSNVTTLTGDFDRDVEQPVWKGDGSGLFFQYDEEGDTDIGFVTVGGELFAVADRLGGTSLGRPYSGGSFSVSNGDAFAYTFTTPYRPADVAVGRVGESAGPLTELNSDLLGHKRLGAVEELWVESSFDGRRVQSWVVTPPDYDSTKTYPMILEIHGGPFANYGVRFSAEVQLYAAAGYAVLYSNPRGSTSYGEEFGNLIHHNYPGQDYDDLMTAVDALIEKGIADPERLYVTGGSGGGVLTSWIVGKTDRFRAAVVAKPVINWTSFALTADAYNFFYRYWFPGYPWEHQENYWSRSPLSLVGNVTTPTMLLTGESDYRTPISESEQYYQALKLRGIETAFVRIPEASHGIAARPSNLIAKVAHILAWFGKYE